MENIIPKNWVEIPQEEFHEWLIKNDFEYLIDIQDRYTYYYEFNLQQYLFKFNRRVFAIYECYFDEEKNKNVWIDPRYLIRIRKDEFSIIEYFKRLFKIKMKPIAV